jgi:hypothetical protein
MATGYRAVLRGSAAFSMLNARIAVTRATCASFHGGRIASASGMYGARDPRAFASAG